MATIRRSTASAGVGGVVAGDIAARIDRLPLTWVQFALAGITQIYWGIIIDTDGFVSRIFPFIWEPKGMSVIAFSVILASNIGAGILVGEYLGGFLSDRYGRRTILLASAVIVGGLMWPIALTDDVVWLVVWNFLYAIGMGFMLATNAVYLHEVAPPGMRHKLAMRTQLLTAVCGLLSALLAFFLIPLHYQWFIWGLALAQFVILVPLGLLLPESPRWLESKGRVEEADRIVSRWERWVEKRRGPLPPPDASRNPVVQMQHVPAGELFRGKYGRRTILVLVVWLLGYPGVVYGGLSYQSTYLVANHWTAQEIFFWTAIVAVPVRVLGFYACSLLGERVERKYIVMLTGVLWSACYLLLLAVPSRAGQMALLVCSFPLASLWLFNMYNYTSAAYPTRLRSVGTGWTDGVAHAGTFLGPLVIGPLFVLTAEHGHWGWIAWVAICTIIPSLLIGRLGMKQRAGILEQMST
jgi:MFS family permease